MCVCHEQGIFIYNIITTPFYPCPILFSLMAWNITYVWNIFYYRYCLWILGNAKTLLSSGSIWADLVRNAKDRRCFFNGSNNKSICRVIAKQKCGFNRVNVKKNTLLTSSRNCGVWVLSCCISSLLSSSYMELSPFFIFFSNLMYIYFLSNN